MLSIAAAGLGLLVVRGVHVGGPFPWADLTNALGCIMLLVLVVRRPDLLRSLSWTGFALFLLNALDGLFYSQFRPVAPVHVLLPLLVLYGTLLGDRSLSIAATLVVLSMYAWSAVIAWPLSRSDALVLTNLAVATVMVGLASLSVWQQHRKLMEDLDAQAHDLRLELDARMRLSSILFHDISNPLTALLHIASVARKRPSATAQDLEKIESMAKRMHSIIVAARDMENERHTVCGAVTIRSLYDHLSEVFVSRLAGKEQRFLLSGGGELSVHAPLPTLCHSVLGNIMNNAVKFSPRGSSIEMVAQAEGNHVRIEIRDGGSGFAADVLRQGVRGDPPRSREGTEGEGGSGYGMQIAAFCADRLGGALEVRNRSTGGSAVAVLLPASISDSTT